MKHAVFAPVAAALLLGFGLSGCAGGARSTMMTATSASVAPVSAGQPGYQAFRVGTVGGGGKTNPLWVSNVSALEFKTALESSLETAGHLAVDPARATHEITAELTDLDRPMAGISMSVTSSVRYKARPVAGGEPTFDKLVAATGTAKFGDALVGTERLRLANEASIRENISAFIARLRETLAAAPTATKPVS